MIPGECYLMEECKQLRNDGKGKDKYSLRSDFCLQLEKYHFDACKEMMRSTFDELLVAFMRGKLAGKCIISIPILCGDGRPVDLFKLFWVVRKIGGHYTVTKNNLWGFVSKQCGLGFGVIPFIKLVYFKYLNELNQWLYVFTKSTSEDALNRIDKKLDILSWDLENRLRGLSWDKQEQKEQEKDSEFVKYTTLDISDSESHLSLNGEINGQVENVVDFFLGEDGRLCTGNNHFCVAVDESIVYGLHGHVDRGIKDDCGVLTKREIGTVLNKAICDYKGQTDMEYGKYKDEDSDGIITSAKKAIEKIICKVLNSGETVANVGHRVDNSIDASMQLDDVATTSFNKAQVSVNIIDEEKLCIEAGNDTIIPSNDICDALEPRKRKRESLSFPRMLSWLTHAAEHSDDPSIGSIPECSKWSSYGVEEFWIQVLLVREALLIKRSSNMNAGENIFKYECNQDQQKKPRMHPSMYEDDVLEFRSQEERRYSRRITSLTKPKSCPCCSSLAHQSQNAVRKGVEVGKNLKETAKLGITDLVEPSTSLDDQKSAESEVKQVSVGPLFQAEVPEWTEVVSESDVKWLGTTVWKPDNAERNSIQSLCIGKGRQNTCNCPFPGSVECVRFHIAETRLKLKQGLGPLFYHWRFNRMGEEISLSWTEEQEKIFKDVMRSGAAFPNKFWNNSPRLLSSKTREMLVSYYFNVYVVQRRSYQNRVIPKDIDSDDDEKECGMIGGSFGHNRALCISGSTLISCSLNKQPTE